jgi:hypothetical protein
MSMIVIALTLATATMPPSAWAVTRGKELGRTGELITSITTANNEQAVDQLLGIDIDLPQADCAKLRKVAHNCS